MDTHVNSSKREVTSGRVNHDELNGEDLLHSGVPLTTVGDLHKLINDTEAGKHDELLFEMTNDDRMETMDAIGTICKSFQADNNNVDVIPCKVSHVDDSISRNVDESTIPSDPIIQSVDINTKSTSYVGVAGTSAKDQPKVNSNFHTLVADPVYDGVNISISRKVVEKVSTRFEHTLYGYFIRNRIAFSVVEYYARNNWEKHGLKRIMMNSKGFFFFEFDSRDGLDAVMEGGPWFLKRMGRSSFARCLIEVNSEADLVDVVTIGILSLYEDDFTKETIRAVSPSIVTTSNVVTPTIEKTNDGFQTVGKKKKRKCKSKSTNGGQFTGLSVKQNVRYEPKTTGNSSKKDNLSISNSFSALNDEEEDDEEDVQNVYDESTNLILNTKAGGSSSFTAAAGEDLIPRDVIDTREGSIPMDVHDVNIESTEVKNTKVEEDLIESYI
ncbi:zinc knuckle CX2CX4HX4C containing protein [Tanacetum coccineum]